MRTLIKAEWKKIISHRFFVPFLFVLLSFYGLMLFYQLENVGKNQYSQGDLAEAYQELRGISLEEKAKRLEKQEEEAGQEKIDVLDETAYMEQYRKFLVRQTIREHVKESQEYQAYLESVLEQADNWNASLFAQTQSYARRNNESVAQQYAALSEVECSADTSVGVAMLTQNPWLDLSFLIGMFFLIQILTVEEKTGGYFSFLRTKVKAEKELYWAKWVAFLSGALFFFVLFYGGTYVFAWGKNCMCDLNLSVQSLELYYQCPYSLRVKDFLAFFCGIKMLGYLVICTLFFVAGICSNTYLGNWLLIIIVGSSSLLFYGNKVVGIGRECNLISLVDGNHYFITYQNVNVFGIPVSNLLIGIICMLCYIGLGAVISGYVWKHPLEWRQKEAIPRKRRRKKRVLCKATFSLEGKKLFFHGKGLLLTVLFLAVLCWWNLPRKYTNFIDLYYEWYAKSLEGTLSDQKVQFLEKEKEWLETTQERIAVYYEKYEQGMLSQTVLEHYVEAEKIPLEREQAFSYVTDQYQELEKRQNQGDSVVFLKETGWKRWFGEENRQKQKRQYVVYLIYLILMFSSFYSVEYEQGVNQLIQVSKDGTKKVWRAKILWCLITGGVTGGILYLSQMYAVHAAWSLEGWNSIKWGMSSIIAAGNAWNIPIFSYLVLGGILHVLAGMAAAAAILLLSKQTRHSLVSGILSFLILGIFSISLL